MTIGDRIKKLRLKTGMTQVGFADAINVSKQTLYKYEHNIVTNIPSDKIEAIAAICNVSPAYLMGWDENTIYIADNLKHIMILKNRSNEVLSNKINIPIEEINKIFKTGRAPLSYIPLLSDALEITTKYLTQLSPDEITLDKLQEQASTKTIVKINSLFCSLNSFGLKEAYKRVEELTYIPKYTANLSMDFDNITTINAANARTDIEIPEGFDTSDDDIMDDENF